jgi:hypothetical protein
MRRFFQIFIVMVTLANPLLAFNKLTVLTQSPIQGGGWTGHQAVNGSILRGLTSLGIHYNFNPTSCDEIGDVVYVPANIEALRIAIDLKLQGRVKILLAGPNLVVRPVEYDGIVTHPAIDLCIVPSQWCKNFYEEDAPSLRGRIAIWPAGVDTSFWQPNQQNPLSKHVLIYQKASDELLYQGVENLLQVYGWLPYRLDYGSYDYTIYRKLLDITQFAIFLSRSESQGIALAECWSMNIPTFVWNAQEPLVIQGKRAWPVSSAPYLTANVGALWKDLTELEMILNNIEQELVLYKPRAWVLKNMCDQVTAQKIIDLINEIEQGKPSEY